MPYKPPLSEPIAIVASSCRFAGGATSPSKLWDILRQPSDLSRRVPADRFNARAFFHPDGDYHGTTDAPNAYWLDDDCGPREFDAAFFGIAPKEAEAVDPQQRLLLETVYEALESAGFQLPQWAGKDVAVYVGAMTADFDSISQRDDLTTSPYYATGNARSILSNRISYFYDFRGPSATIDTACSSSLVALHQAVLSLRAGDCSAACVAGVNLMLAPEQFVVESSLHMLSPKGHCHMWDSRADGYARGEGAAVLFLKPLSRALADGDVSRIQALIRETGVGSDGRTAGITMPSPGAQASLIRATYQRAGLDISDAADRCQYFEAHGTGTPVGDPREAKAIYSAFFGELANADQNGTVQKTDSPSPPPLLVGSIKTVIGHTEGAAGVAGILKVILAMKNAKLPPNLHMERLSQQVAPFCTPSAQGHLRIPTELMDWPLVPAGQPRRASVNSFGFGGTNAHAIVEHYDPSIHSPHLPFLAVQQPAPVVVVNLPHIPLFLSANSASTLRSLAKKYLEFFQQQQNGKSQSSFAEVAWRSYMSRTPFLHRLAIHGSSRTEAIDMLSSLVSDTVQGQPKEFGSRARRVENKAGSNAPQLLGIFTGQGAQWPGMSKELFLTNCTFRESIRSMDRVLRECPHPPNWTLECELQKLDEDGSRVLEAAIGQPLCTALQIGLVNVLDRLGLRFTCVVGHSSGEISAAYAAKYLSARDAILIAYFRGTSIASLTPPRDSQEQKGGMLAAGLSYADADVFCLSFSGRLCVAASNSPSSTTLSGDIDAVDKAEQQLKTNSVFVRRLRIDNAYHSHHMAQHAGAYAKALEVCQISPLARSSEPADGPAWISSVSPEGPAPTSEQLACSYWVDNMVKPVLFREAVEKALSAVQGEFDCVVEVGPHSTLRGPFADTSAQSRALGAVTKNLPYTSLLRRGRRGDDTFSEFLGFVWTRFDPPLIDFRGVLGDAEKITLSASLSQLHGDGGEKLPAYPWDHTQKYYRESRVSRQFHHKSNPPHELLGSRTRDDIDGCELRWRNLLRIDKLPWLAHHAFQGQPLLPASAYCIMALDAAKVLLAGRVASVVELEDVEFVSGIPLEVDGPATEIMFSLTVQHQPGKAVGALDDGNDNSIRASFCIFSTLESVDTPMRKRCTGYLHIILGAPTTDALPSRGNPSEQPEAFRVTSDSFYHMMADLGLQYSGPFEALESMQRRHNFASATLRRVHREDTTGLSFSPATLDSCLQTCFASYSSPGDKALWTVFLPIHMKKISFNMAHGGISGVSNTPLSMHLAVDTQLTQVQEPTYDSPTRITGDICIYNEDGDMEIQVEGLTVGSLASTHPNADREPYLTTTFLPDPEDVIVQNWAQGADDEKDGTCDRLLEESCERIVTFYNTAGQATTAWPSDTEDTLDQLIISSWYSLTLEKIRACVKEDDSVSFAGDRSCPLQSMLEEGRHAYQFQRQVASITKQIAFKYPRMSVFSLTDAEICMSTFILKGLGSAFASYTSLTLGATDKSFEFLLTQSPADTARKVHAFSLNQTDDIKTQLAKSMHTAKNQPFDLAILSTSIFKHAASSEAVLDQVKALLRPGGFLILVHMPIKLPRGRDRQVMGLTDAIITPPDWPDILDQRGFTNLAIKNTDQHYPGGFSITVRQSESLVKKRAAQLPGSLSFAAPALSRPDDRLLVIGGRTAEVCSLASYTSQLLSCHLHNPVTTVFGLGELVGIDTETLSSFTCVVLLADLDDNCPVLSSLDDRQLDALRNLLLRPEITILWVTKGARSGNAENAASYGFTRSIRAETPSLVLQMLDFDHLHTAGGELRASCQSKTTTPSVASVVANTFLCLMLGARQKRKQDILSAFDMLGNKEQAEHLWSLETEVYMDSTGHRLIPRVVPFQSSNDNFNSSRRVITQRVNTLSISVKLVRDMATRAYQTQLGPPVASMVESILATRQSANSNSLLVQVHYSSAKPLFRGHYVCIGRCEATGDIVAVTSETNASFVSVPCGQAIIIAKAGIDTHESNRPAITHTYTTMLMRMLVCYLLLNNTENTPIVLVAADDQFLQCSKHAAAKHNRSIVSIQVPGSSQQQTQNTMCDLFIHPRATASQMKSILYRFKEGAVFVNFLPAGHKISRFMSSTMPPSYTCHSWGGVVRQAQPEPRLFAGFNSSLLQQVVTATNSAIAEFPQSSFPRDFMSVPSLLSLHTTDSNTLNIVDWRAERTVDHTVHPHESALSQSHTTPGTQLRSDRTYVLIGITRDMGQSLSTLFIKQGARHIVLASRSPETAEPLWAQNAGKVYGVDVRFETLDVTDLAAVQQFRARIEQAMPPIGGIVNGAMVLDDRVFAQMTADIFSRVMRPKTVGSRNLDLIFRDDDADADKKLDFFIMTSSFAAIGGHAGQSNYAAANMYMNGVAANRQRRGVAGSVLNIGVVYGLGFLHREKEQLYAGLEREGYPPVSERDLHHMFLEAIALGRPKSDENARKRYIVDLTAGLDRFNPNQAAEVALHWHTDPRFSHFTVKGDDDDSGQSASSGNHAGGAGSSSSTKLLADLISKGIATADVIGQQLAIAFSERLAMLLHLGPVGGDESDNGGNNSRIRGDSSLVEVGVDSLVAVETRTWLWRTTGRDVPVMKILGAASIDRLCMDIAGDIVAGRS